MSIQQYKVKFFLSTLLFLSPATSSFLFANTPNEEITSFNKAKRLLLTEVYVNDRTSFYCKAEFDMKKIVTPPLGFESPSYKKRAKKIEWEHVVAAEWFGQTFKEWREGDPKCVTKKGEKFKGRNCASKLNTEYRLMQSDMYNLVPAIGSVNAKRSNYRFTQFNQDEPSDFGSCEMKISDKKAEPPAHVRGEIARAHLYMDAAYSRFSLSKAQRQLMNAWDKMHPVSEFECKKTKRIEQIQRNTNETIKSRCIAAKLWF